MPERGRLTEWNDERGFGFVTPLDGDGRLFVHVSEFPRDKRRPEELDLLTYDVSHDERGGPRAVHVDFLAPVEPVEHHGRSQAMSSPTMGEVIAVALFFLVVSLLVVTGRVPLFFLGIYLVLSLALFAVYGADKSAAVGNRRRTPEATLHLMALVGGWPGALMARTVFHHKTRKQPFSLIFWCTVVANCAGLLWLSVAGLPG